MSGFLSSRGVSLRQLAEASVERLARIDAVCHAHEQAIFNGAAASLENALALAPQPDELLFRELLLTEIEARRRCGQTLNPAEYVERFPQFAAVVVEAFERAARGAETTVSGARRERSTADTEDFSARALCDTARHEVVPRAIGNFELLGEIGRGGMGLVLKGRDADLDRDVAVKVLLEKHRDRPELTHRFLKEARINGQLQHPGVVPVYELGRFADKRPYFAMKLVEGRTLAELLQERRDPAQECVRFLKVFEQICQTLAYAHARRVIHRDLKPHNIMVGAFGEVQVMDWGLGKVLGDSDDSSLNVVGRQQPDESFVTQAGVGLGTLAYMPPEQARGEAGQIDARSDVFGLGAILCEILTGDPPYAAKCSAELYRHAQQADLADAFARLDRCGADGELISLAKRCLAADPAARPRDAGVLAGDVAAYLESVEARLRRAELDRAAAEVEAREQRRRRKLTLSLATAVVIVFALLGGGALWLQSQYADTQRNVEAALAKAEQAYAQFLQMPAGNADEAAAAVLVLERAQAAIDEAQSVLATGISDTEVRLRAAELRRSVGNELSQLELELRLFRELDEARMARLTWVQTASVHDRKFAEIPEEPAGSFDFAGSIARYRSAFANFGLHDMPLNAEATVAEIRDQRQAAREAIVVALDDWSEAVARQDGPSSAAAQRLYDMAQEVDENTWRVKARRWRKEVNGEQLALAAGEALGTPESAATVELLARSLIRAGRMEDAISLLRRAQIVYADDVWIHLALGEVLDTLPGATELELQEAVGCYKAAIAVRPDCTAAINNLAADLTDQGDLDGAISACDVALAIDPGFTFAKMTRGCALTLRGDFEAAIPEFRSALESSPQLSEGHYNLGATLEAQGDLNGALRAYEAALRLKPRYVRAHRAMGRVLAGKHDLQGAVRCYRAALAIKPQRADSLYNLGNDFMGVNDLEDAVVAYQTALAANPKLAQAQNNLGLALAGQADTDGAIAAYKAALEIDPRLPEAHFNLGNALFGEGDADGAIIEFKRAIAINPQYANAFHNLAVVLNARQDVPGAIAAYEAALQIESQNPDALLHLSELLSSVGEFVRAADALRQCLDQLPPDDARRRQMTRQLQILSDLCRLDAKLNDVLAGSAQPADNRERAGFVRICRARHRYAAAARFFSEAFADEPALAHDLSSGQRHHAACCAALAGCGQGQDAADLPEQRRTALRRQAVDWLRADLLAYAELIQGGGSEHVQEVAQKLQHWLHDPDLSGIRDEEQLVRLQEDEQQTCRQLWAEVDAVLLHIMTENEPLEADCPA